MAGCDYNMLDDTSDVKTGVFPQPVASWQKPFFTGNFQHSDLLLRLAIVRENMTAMILQARFIEILRIQTAEERTS